MCGEVNMQTISRVNILNRRSGEILGQSWAEFMLPQSYRNRHQRVTPFILETTASAKIRFRTGQRLFCWRLAAVPCGGPWHPKAGLGSVEEYALRPCIP